MLATLGCVGNGPREAPFPAFDLGDAPRAPAVLGEAVAATQLPVTLGGPFLATLTTPAQGGEWTWSEQLDGKATLITRISGGNPPDVVIYAERAPEDESMPSVQFRRFLAVADGGGDDLPTWGLRYASGLAAHATAEAGEGTLKEPLMPVASSFMGGLGFASTPGTFSGWKWVGRTVGVDGTGRVDVRLGRWSGVWTDGMTQVSSALAGLETVSTTSGWWLAQRDALKKALDGKVGAAGAATTRSPGRPATMLAGSVQLPHGGSDVYVAAICAEPCGYEREIHGLFETLRTGTADELRGATQASARRDPGAHERQARVVLVDTNSLAEALEKAATESERAPSTAGTP